MDRRLWAGALMGLLLPLSATATPVASRQTQMVNNGVKAVFDKASGKPTIYGVSLPLTFTKADAGKMLEIVADSPKPVKIELWTGNIPVNSSTWSKGRKFLGSSGQGFSGAPSFKWMIEPGDYTAIIITTLPPGTKPDPFLLSYGKEVRPATAEDKAEWDKAVNDFTLGRIRALQAKRTPAPAFTGFATDRNPISLSQYRNKVVLLYFWSTQGEGASDTFALINSLAQKYKPQGLEVIGISLDTDQATFDQAIQNYAPTWRQMFDGRTGHEALAAKYEVNGWSATFILDATGRIITRDLYGAALEKAIVNAVYENQQYQDSLKAIPDDNGTAAPAAAAR